MRVSFNTMELMENREKGSVGSSRIRANWLINHWPDAELFHIGRKYDAVIFQKAYDFEFMRAYQGVKIFDLCDADWLHGRPVVEALRLCDAATTSTPALAAYLQQMTDKPVVWVDDRVDLNEFPQQKEHKGPAKSVLWYGYVDNHSVLDPCLPAIQRLGLKLVVLSNMPYVPQHSIQGINEEWLKDNLLNLRYDQEYFNQDLLLNADIVLNPKLDFGRFKYKSENKTVISWALGIPVAHDAEELEALLAEAPRAAEAQRRRAQVVAEHSVERSVQQYKDLIAQIAANKK